MMTPALWRASAAFAFACIGQAAMADAVSDFYTGRTVNLVIGFAPGGGYDLYARTLARHLGRHIPGRPNVVVQNMPGAGSIKATNYLYAIAPKDGATVGGFSRGIFLDPLLGRGEGMQYDAPKFGWLGSISNEVGVCAFRSGAGIFCNCSSPTCTCSPTVTRRRSRSGASVSRVRGHRAACPRCNRPTR